MSNTTVLRDANPAVLALARAGLFTEAATLHQAKDRGQYTYAASHSYVRLLGAEAAEADPVPAMLAALEVAERSLDAIDRGGLSCGAELSQIRDAIAKAKGR